MPSSIDPHAAASLPLTEEHCCMLLPDPTEDRRKERMQTEGTQTRGTQIRATTPAMGTDTTPV